MLLLFLAIGAQGRKNLAILTRRGLNKFFWCSFQAVFHLLDESLEARWEGIILTSLINPYTETYPHTSPHFASFQTLLLYTFQNSQHHPPTTLPTTTTMHPTPPAHRFCCPWKRHTLSQPCILLYPSSARLPPSSKSVLKGCLSFSLLQVGINTK